MSYNRDDYAVETCLQYATVDLASLDPDETAELAERFVRECRTVRDDFDDNGYAKKTDYGSYECGECGGTAVYTDATQFASYCASCATKE